MDIEKLYQNIINKVNPLRTVEKVIAPFFCFRCLKIIETGYLCHNCCNLLQLQLTISCPFCQRRKPLTESLEQSCCDNSLRSLLAFGLYEEPTLSQMVKIAKYQGYFKVFTYLGQLLAIELARLKLLTTYKLVPIPLHPLRLRHRGFNQAEVLARTISQITSLEVSTCLERIVNNQPQASLSGQARLENVKDVFQAKPPISDNIIIVDDIWTTGATMITAATLLKQQGAKKILGLVILK